MRPPLAGLATSRKEQRDAHRVGPAMDVGHGPLPEDLELSPLQLKVLDLLHVQADTYRLAPTS